MKRRIIAISIVMACVLGIAPAARADNIAAAGDISNPPGGFRGDTATAALLDPASGNGIGLVLPLGDNQYQCGELAANRSKRCTVVYGHHPYLASAAPYPVHPDLKDIWPTLVLEDVDLFIAGHNHAYERLARIRTQGNVDEDWGPGDGDDGHAGVPTIVVGTGGSSLIPFGQIHPASRVRIAGRYGVLKIVPDYPSPGRWIHAFKGTDGSTLDRVEMRCH